jgi:DNA/RNA endonuclease G (NUC1)
VRPVVIASEAKQSPPRIWSSLEGLVQTLATARAELFVITGPVYQGRTIVKVSRKSDACKSEFDLARPDEPAICPAHNRDPKTKCDTGVAVPAALFKIIYDPGQGGRVNAYLLPNLDHRPLKQQTKTLDYLRGFQVGVNTIEDLTGYKFFGALPARKQLQLKESCGATMLH